jgi:hypothetical protein
MMLDNQAGLQVGPDRVKMCRDLESSDKRQIDKVLWLSNKINIGELKQKGLSQNSR